MQTVNINKTSRRQNAAPFAVVAASAALYAAPEPDAGSDNEDAGFDIVNQQQPNVPVDPKFKPGVVDPTPVIPPR